MSHNCKNYKTDGGNTLVIGGKLKFETGAVVEGGSSVANTPATADALGVVKIGAGVNVTSAGVISVDTGSSTKKGLVKVGTNVNVDSNGVISINDAGANTKGLVKQGAAVADAAGEAPTAAEFKALLDSLRDAGIIAES